MHTEQPSIELSADQRQFVSLLAERIGRAELLYRQQLATITECRDLFLAAIIKASGITEGQYKLNVAGTALIPAGEQNAPEQPGGES